MIYVVVFLFSLSAFAGLPVDIVFDMDQTVLTEIEPGPHSDLLADPGDPQKGTFTITYERPQVDPRSLRPLPGTGDILQEKYRVYEGVGDLLQELKKLQAEGLVRVHFFSGGTLARNTTALKEILLPDGSSAFELAEGKRIYGGQHLTPTDAPASARFSERFKKDLSFINKDLSDVLLIDDVKFVPDHQRAHLLWIDDRFPYEERLWRLPSEARVPTPELIFREKYKFDWISEKLLSALEKRIGSQKSFISLIADETAGHTLTPFSPGEAKTFRPMSCMGPSLQTSLEALLRRD